MLEIGSSLRRARGCACLELAEVEAATMIPARYLSALEEEQFERLPADPYRRSFLLEYAAFLGLDAELYAKEYALRFTPPEPEPPAPSRPDRGWIVRALPVRVAGALALAALAGVLVWQLGGQSGTHPLRPPAATTTTRSRPASSARTLPPAHPPVKVATSPRPARRPALTLTATHGPCWLLVQLGSSAGAAVYVHTLRPGQSVRFGLRKPLWIRLGAPWNLDAAIGTRSVTASLPAQTGDVVVTAAGLHTTT